MDIKKSEIFNTEISCKFSEISGSETPKTQRVSDIHIN